MPIHDKTEGAAAAADADTATPDTDEGSVHDKVQSIITEQLGVDSDEVTEAASFTDDLGADSLDIVELVMAFEEEFGIEIPDEDAEKIEKVRDAIAYIEEHAEKDEA